jgi:hypothetical protein
MRYPIRASELDHRRPSGSAPTPARYFEPFSLPGGGLHPNCLTSDIRALLCPHIPEGVAAGHDAAHEQASF